MDHFAAAAILVPLGIGALLPRPSGAPGSPPGSSAELGPGLRFMTGWCISVIVLFLAGVCGLPLHVAAWVLAGAAAAGLALEGRRALRGGDRFREAIAHPLAVLPAIIAVMLIVAAPGRYEIMAWDAWTNWIGWSRQMVVADAIYRPEMWIATRGDTPGWPLAMALPGFLGGRFVTENAWAVAMTLHVGLLASIFDFVRRFLERALGPRAALAAWIFILLALCAELTWTLVPTLLLIEEPQFYLLATVLIALATGIGERRADAALAAAAAAAMAGAYLFKGSFITFAPGFALIAAWWLLHPAERWSLQPRSLFLLAAVLALPVALMAVWSLAAPAGRCQAAPGAMIARLVGGGDVHGTPLSVFVGLVAARMAAFGFGWKLPVSLIAVAGLAAYIRKPACWVAVVAGLATAAVFFVGLVGGMATCFSADEISDLASVQRYMRVPLRLFQTMGVCLLVVAAGAAVARIAPRIRLPRGVTAAAALAALAVLGGWQVVQIDRAFRMVAERPNIDAGFQRSVKAAARDADIALAQAGTGDPARRVVIAELGHPPYVEEISANFAGLGERRGDPTRRLEAHRFPLDAGSPALVALGARLAEYDAVAVPGPVPEPLARLPQIAPALAAGCAPGPAGFLFVRRSRTEPFECVVRQ